MGFLLQDIVHASVGNLPSTRRSNPWMNSIDADERSLFTCRESDPEPSVRLWGAPVVGFTNGSKLMT
jgi:hypothetical protein